MTSGWLTFYTIAVVLEFIILSVMLAAYLRLLVDRIDQINHLNFITEKRVLFTASTVFMITYVLRTLFNLIISIDPSLMGEVGAFKVILIETSTTIVFEILPMGLL